MGGHCGHCQSCRRGDFVNCQNQPAWQRILVDAPSDAGDSALPRLSGYPLPADLCTGTEDHGSGGALTLPKKTEYEFEYDWGTKRSGEGDRGGRKYIFFSREIVRLVSLRYRQAIIRKSWALPTTTRTTPPRLDGLIVHVLVVVLVLDL
jgi:hypothetical protein